MLQIPKPNLFNNPGKLADFTANYSIDIEAASIIKAKDQNAILKSLSTQINQEKFYFTCDAKTNTISGCNGISKWLGYSDSQFTEQYYSQIIHPAHSIIQSYYGWAFQHHLLNDNIKLQFFQPLLISTIALKHKTGKYIYCKRETYAFQIGANNTLLEYLNIFTIIKDYENEGYSSRLPISINEEKLNAVLKKIFEQTTDFSVQEMRILKRYAQNKATTSIEIAKAFKIEKTTVSTYNKRILRKAEIFFSAEFVDARQVAVFLKKQKLI